ncbi:MAG: hypothetical protein AAF320_04110, partial [Myxococcota bacterium]
KIGKTTLIKQFGKSNFTFTLKNKDHFQSIKADTEGFFSRCYKTVFLEEIQQLPQTVKSFIKVSQKNPFPCGSFLLSSNFSPLLLGYSKEKIPNHMVCVEMGGFQLAETWKRPCSKLCDYITLGQPEKFHALKCLYTQQELLLSCLTGSYPEPALNRLDRSFCHRWHTKRLHTYINQEIGSFYPQLKLPFFTQTMYKLAQLSASTLPVESLTQKVPKISNNTLKRHVKILEGTRMWRHLSTYPAALQRKDNETFGLVQDSGLLCHMLKIASLEELENHPCFPAIWRSFVWEELLKGFLDRRIPIKAYSSVTHSSESLLFLEGPFGLIPIGLQTDWGLRGRQHALHTLNTEVSRHKNCPYGILFSLGNRIRQVSEKLFEIPAGCL